MSSPAYHPEAGPARIGAWTLAPGSRNRQRDDVVVAPVLERRTPRGDREALVVDIQPRLLVLGQRDVRITVELAMEPKGSWPLARWRRPVAFANGDRALWTGGSTTLRGTPDGGRLVLPLGEVTAEHLDLDHLRLELDGGPPIVIPHPLRVAARIELALTFDDGPSVERYGDGSSNGTSTGRVLDELATQGLCAAFFVLTGPDRFRPWYGRTRTYAKAETPEGFELLIREARERHLLAVHWGGGYRSQHELHPSRLSAPPWDIDGDGEPEGDDGLHSDLLACKARIAEAYARAGVERTVRFVRPPLWVSHNADGDARPVYEKTGLQLIATDAKLADGGYPGAGYTFTPWLCRGLRGAFARGISEPILTLHDSNPRTARDLHGVLDAVADFMAAEGFAPEQWCFVSDPDRLEAILTGRRRFAIGD